MEDLLYKIDCLQGDFDIMYQNLPEEVPK